MNDRGETRNSNDPTALRAEIERLNAELALLRARVPQDRDVDSVTDHLALQQEVDTLRQSMREKERILDVTSAQCRRVEDELEDQYLAYDGLKQDLERKKLSLAQAREQATRLSNERQEIEERYQALLEQRRDALRGEHGGEDSPMPLPRAALLPSSNSRFVSGFIGGALVAGVILVVALRLGSFSFTESETPPTQTQRAPPAQAQAQGPAVSQAPAPETEPEQAPESASDTQPGALGTVRDRLRDGSFGPLMVAVRGGHFTMGKPLSLPNQNSAPPHAVTLRPFLAGATEVTFEEYDRFVRATAGRFPSDFGWGRGRRPVVDVSWDEAQAYTEWLSTQTDQRYRLLSEAEWEYVAAAGTRTTFWWGYEAEKGRAVCFDCGTLWDNRSTAPAGSFNPNPLGLYDTAGNALEWVADCYHPNYLGAPTDGSAWTTPGCVDRVARGGAFNKPALSMTSKARRHFAAQTRLDMLGFRLGRDD